MRHVLGKESLAEEIAGIPSLPRKALVARWAKAWQAHSVRGAISGALKKKLGLAVSSEKSDGRGRVYRIAERG